MSLLKNTKWKYYNLIENLRRRSHIVFMKKPTVYDNADDYYEENRKTCIAIKKALKSNLEMPVDDKAKIMEQSEKIKINNIVLLWEIDKYKTVMKNISNRNTIGEIEKAIETIRRKIDLSREVLNNTVAHIVNLDVVTNPNIVNKILTDLENINIDMRALIESNQSINRNYR